MGPDATYRMHRLPERENAILAREASRFMRLQSKRFLASSSWKSSAVPCGDQLYSAREKRREIGPVPTGKSDRTGMPSFSRANRHLFQHSESSSSLFAAGIVVFYRSRRPASHGRDLEELVTSPSTLARARRKNVPIAALDDHAHRSGTGLRTISSRKK